MTSEARLRAGTLAILAVGFATAIAIYLTAQPPPENPLGYDPLDTKKYLHDLEVYGGKANVIAAEFREWFDSLWHGKQLALTVAVITVIATFVFRFFAMRLPPGPQASGVQGGKPSHREGTGRNVLPFDPKDPRPRGRAIHSCLSAYSIRTMALSCRSSRTARAWSKRGAVAGRFP